jgi:transcriptional regulator with XRE-family HTH domain
MVLPEDASPADKLKYNLCRMMVEYRLKEKISQKELAKQLGTDEPEVSRILRYRIERYTVDRLIHYAEKVYPNLKIALSAA